MKRLLPILLLLSCAPDDRLQGVPCQTTSGVRLFGSNDCGGFQLAEDRAVAVFSKHYVDVVDRIFMFAVYVQPSSGVDNSWQSPARKTVRGLTWCRQHTIQIGSADWRYSSYAHELLHAAECGEYVVGEDPHAAWDGGWQESAIKEAQVRP